MPIISSPSQGTSPTSRRRSAQKELQVQTGGVAQGRPDGPTGSISMSTLNPSSTSPARSPATARRQGQKGTPSPISPTRFIGGAGKGGVPSVPVGPSSPILRPRLLPSISPQPSSRVNGPS